MKINFAHLCDYATISREGKLSVLGIFTQIRATQLPYTHPQAFLAFELEINYAELGRPISIEIQCVDADGNIIFGANGQALLAKKDGTPKPGDRPRVAQALSIQNLTLNRSGAHDINIFLNGALTQQISFEVVHVPQQVPPIEGSTPPAAT